jgi:hypothetical protein
MAAYEAKKQRIPKRQKDVSRHRFNAIIAKLIIHLDGR